MQEGSQRGGGVGHSPDPARPDSAPKRRRLAPELRRAQIIKAAREVFIESGFPATRTRDIARRAGITEPSIYNHFESKEAIYELAVREPLELLVERLVNDTNALASDRSVTRADLFSHFHELMLECMVEIAPLLAVSLFCDVTRGREFYVDFVVPSFARAIGSVIVDVTGWQEDTVEFSFLVERLFGLHFGVAWWAVLDDRPLDTVRVGRQLAIMYGGGISDSQVDKERPTLRRAPTRTRATKKPARSTTVPAPSGRMSAPERKSAIVAAAREVFIENGFSAARTEDIAERAGISKAFMFRMFASKEELYHEAIEAPLIQLYIALEADALEVSRQDELNSVAKLERLLELLLIMTVNGAPMIAVALFSEINRGRKFYLAECAERFATVQRVVSDIVGWKPPLVDNDIAMHGIFGAVYGTALDYMLRDVPREQWDLKAVARRVTALLTLGIRERA